MKRKFMWSGIILLNLIFLVNCGPAPLGVAGGYVGWPDDDTVGTDAKLTSEMYFYSHNPALNGLWINYANYNNDNLGQHMVSLSTYVDHSAPLGEFTTDGARSQHFYQHVGQLITVATDTNKDGIICWVGCDLEAGSPGGGDFTLADALCPQVGGTANSSGNPGFVAYCDRGLWLTLGEAVAVEETKKSPSPHGLKYWVGSLFGNGLSMTTLGRIMASSTVLGGGGFAVKINAVSLPSGAAHTLATPVTVNVFGGGASLFIDADQPSMKELASWLASQWQGKPDGSVKLTATFNGGAVTASTAFASGNSVATALNKYASW